MNTQNSLHIEAAANWKATLTSGDTSAEEQQAFKDWLHANPDHRKAYATVEEFWGSFDGLQAQGAKTALQSLPSGKSIMRNTKAYLSIAALIAGSWAMLQSPWGDHYLADYSTASGEMREIALEDGSVVRMNTGTAMDVSYSNSQRLIKLRQGEIIVTVAKSPQRSFIVATSNGTAEALGTQYQVKHLAGNTAVAVIESTVKVCQATGIFRSSQVECLTLQPGTGVAEIKPGMVSVPVNLDEATAWTSGFISFEATPLSVVLRELERYAPGKIYFDAKEMNQLQVSGVIPVTDMDKAYAMLAKLLPISVEQYPYLAVIKRKDAAQAPQTK